MNRRSFLSSILAAGIAPAVVGSGILMPVRKIIVPPLVINRIPGVTPTLGDVRERFSRVYLAADAQREYNYLTFMMADLIALQPKQSFFVEDDFFSGDEWS